MSQSSQSSQSLRCSKISHGNVSDRFNYLYETTLADEEEGMWLVDIPYVPIVENNVLVSRLYLNLANASKCNDPMIQLWRHKDGKNFYVNGKPVSEGFLPTFTSKIKLNPVKETKVVTSINSDWYDIFYLVCGRLKGINNNELFSCLKSCTTIGSNIAKAMIKVAATRIFSVPEQSIVEIIANSIDSYSSKNGNSKVGRFGMGFFSFLYYLVDHPKRCLHIHTTTFDKKIKDYTTIYLRIMEIDKTLKFSIQVVDTKTTTTGTIVHLDCAEDNFTWNEFSNFLGFRSHLRMIESTPIVNLTDNSLLTTKTTFPSSYRESIFTMINSEGIKITDYAEGMPIDVILNSLLIPSISTKGIVANTRQVSYKNYSSIFEETNPNFSIVVNRVVIVNIPLKVVAGSKSYGIVISLPSSVVLPVTRDDIVLSSVEKEFTESLTIILKEVIKKKDLTILENALQKYKAFTSNIDNKKFIDNYISGVYHSLRNKVIIPPSDESIYKAIYPDYLIGTRVNTNINELAFRKIVPGNENIFANKRIVLLGKDSNVQQPSTGSTYSYIFVPYHIHSKVDWDKSFPLVYKYDYLDYSGNNDTSHAVHGALKNSLFSKIRKHADKMIHLYTCIKNACTVKVEHVTDAYILQKVTSFCHTFYEYGGEEYFNEAISKWIIMVSSIEQSKSYGAGKHRIFDSDGENAFARAVGRPTESIPLQPPLLPDNLAREYFNKVFEYNTNHNKKSGGPTVMIFPLWSGMVNIFKNTIYSSNFIKYDINWMEAVLGRYTIAHYLSIDVANKIIDVPEFYKQIKNIYNKYLRGNENFTAIYSNNWGYIPLYSSASKDLALWAGMFVNSTKIPESILDISMNQQFTTKQLINYVFKHDTVDFDKLANESKELDLQILEISINAGTTKSFIEATLTELVQNSMDAIRLTDSKKIIEIEASKIGNGLIAISVQDYVGMTIENLIAINIPFYSNKQASNLVTGEMGTGFFNIYRESKFVLIDTTKDGHNTKLLQVPVRDREGTVLDISTEIRNEETKNANGTKITFVVKCFDEDGELNLYNRVYTFTNEVIGLMDFEGITFNGSPVKKKKELFYQIDELECYYCNDAPTSYILTKGVPFTPLYDFVKSSGVHISDSLLDISRNNIVINMRHGFYTPVQSRTRLNIDPENAKKIQTFLFDALTRSLYKRVLLAINKNPPTISDTGFLENIFRDWSFPGDLRQVVPTSIDIDILSSRRYTLFDARGLLLYYLLPFKGKPLNFQMLIARVSEKTSDRASMEKEIEKLLKELETIYPSDEQDIKLINQVKLCLVTWLSLKHTLEREEESEEESEEEEPEEEKSEEEQIVQIAQIFVDVFTRLANKYTQRYPSIVYPEEILVFITKLPNGTLGFYADKNIVLGKHITGVSKFIKNLPEYIKDNGKLRSDEFYQSLFGYQEPSSLLIHELEHARRSTGHSQLGAHDDVTLEIFGYPEKKYTYSSISNTVYTQLVNDGLIKEWLQLVFKEIHAKDSNNLKNFFMKLAQRD